MAPLAVELLFPHSAGLSGARPDLTRPPPLSPSPAVPCLGGASPRQWRCSSCPKARGLASFLQEGAARRGAARVALCCPAGLCVLQPDVARALVSSLRASGGSGFQDSC